MTSCNQRLRKFNAIRYFINVKRREENTLDLHDHCDMHLSGTIFEKIRILNVNTFP